METSSVECMMLLLASAIGSGALVLPKAMASVGVLPLIALLLAAGAVTLMCTLVLFLVVEQQQTEAAEAFLGARDVEMTAATPEASTTSQSGEASDGSDVKPSLSKLQPASSLTYASLLARATSPAAGILLEVVLLVTGFGQCTSYLLFIKSFLHHIPLWPQSLGDTETILLMAAVVYPLVLPESVGALARLGRLPLLSLAFMACSVALRAPAAAAERTAPVQLVGDLRTAPQVMCVCIFAMNWSTQCVPVARLRGAGLSAKNSLCIACSGVATLIVLYTLVAYVGYVSWGADVKGSLVSMYPENDPVFLAVRTILVCALFVVIPCNIMPMRESCLGLLRAAGGPTQLTFPLRVVLGAVLVGVPAWIAIEFPDVVAVVGILGGLGCTTLLLVFPMLIARLVLSRRAWTCLAAGTTVLTTIMFGSALGLLGEKIPADN